MKDEDYAHETARQKKLDALPTKYSGAQPPGTPEAQENAAAQHSADSGEQCPTGAGGGPVQSSYGDRLDPEIRNRITIRIDTERQQRRADVLPRPWAGGTQASWGNVCPGKGIRVEVAPARFLRKDPNPGIPFIDVYPPSAGVTYWLVCAVVIGGLGALAYLGVWK